MTPKRSRYFLVALIILLVGFMVLAPSYGYRLRDFLSPSQVSSSSGKTETDTATANLAAQNEVLQAQLAKLQVVVGQMSGAGIVSSSSVIRAMVYSRYPLNFKNELLIDAGASGGVVAGKGALFQGVLVGTVYKVFADDSLVQTVFDPGFRMAVRIGDGAVGIDALLQGGTAPAVVSIAKSAAIHAGDIIYSAAPGIPYGLPIGMVGDVSVSANSLFQQASVNFEYDVNAIQTVEVER